jgi:hypothetical protein
VKNPWRNPEPRSEGDGNLRAIEPFSGTRVRVLEGDGKATVVREVVHYFDENGQRIAVEDPFPSGQAP